MNSDSKCVSQQLLEVFGFFETFVYVKLYFLNFHAFFSIAVTVLFTSQIVLFTAICKESKQPSVNFSFPAVKKTPVFSTRGENSCFLNSWKTEVNSSSHEVPQLFVFLQGSQKL